MCHMRPEEDPDDTTTARRKRLAELVKERRRHLGLSVRAAADSGGMARGTWTAVEDGSRKTADSNYAGIERALQWAPGSVAAILAGGDPTVTPAVANARDSMTLTDSASAHVVPAADVAAQRDPILIQVLRRDDITDDQKRRIVEILIAQKEAAERAREDSARRLVDMFRADPDH